MAIEMERIIVHKATVEPKVSAELTLDEGYKNYIIFYPFTEREKVINRNFLSVESVPPIFKLENWDEVFPHTLNVAQFNGPLPEFLYTLEAWQIIAIGL